MKKKSLVGATIFLLTMFIIMMYHNGNCTIMKKLDLEDLTQKAKVIVIGLSQWEIQVSDVTNSLYDVCFVDSLYGWAVGANATIIATTDGGKNWVRQIEPVDTVEFRKVEFINSQVGFVGGNRNIQFQYYMRSDAILLRTVDGGKHWENCDLGFGSDYFFNDLDFVDSNKGYLAIGNSANEDYENRGGFVLRTENGGKNWDIVLQMKPDLVGVITFWDDLHGYSFWVGGMDNYDDSWVYFTDNGGSTWKGIGTIKENSVRKIELLSLDTLWAIGYGISKSQDGGQNWVTWNWFSPVYEGQKRFGPGDIKVFDSNSIWLIGSTYTNPTDNSAVLIITNDSGKTWWLELEIPEIFFSGLSVVSKQHAWIVGERGLILHKKLSITAVDEREESVPQSYRLEQNYPNPFSLSSSYAATKIRFSIMSQQHITITIYDILGRKIKVLLSKVITPGKYSVTWDGRDSIRGLKVPAGVYFYELRSPCFSSKKKMLVIQ